MPYVPDGELFQNALYVGINLQDILYGVHLVLYIWTMYSLLIQGERQTSDIGYAIFSTVMVLLITIWVSTQAIFGERMWLLDAGSPDGWNEYGSGDSSFWYVDWGTTAIAVIQFMTDALMIYRCRMLWNSYRAIIVPSILWVGTLVLGILLIWATSSHGGNFFSGVASQLGLAYYTVSVFLTATLTWMICYRVVQHGRRIKEGLGGEYASPYFAIVALVVESMLPCTLSGIAFLISFGVGNQTAVCFSFVFILMMCISPQMLILRVVKGRAWMKGMGKQPPSTIHFSPKEDTMSATKSECSGEVVHVRTFKLTHTGDDKGPRSVDSESESA